MDATCNVQDSIHVFHLVHNMCPGFWVHITCESSLFISVGVIFKTLVIASKEQTVSLPYKTFIILDMILIKHE